MSLASWPIYSDSRPCPRCGKSLDPLEACGCQDGPKEGQADPFPTAVISVPKAVADAARQLSGHLSVEELMAEPSLLVEKPLGKVGPHDNYYAFQVDDWMFQCINVGTDWYEVRGPIEQYEVLRQIDLQTVQEARTKFRELSTDVMLARWRRIAEGTEEP